MNANLLSTIIQSLLSLILLVVVIFWLWPSQRVDLFRQEMFSLRDELFDFAAAGNIPFDEPAYVLLRQLMNGFIRYAHNLTPYRTLMSFLRWKYISHDPLTAWSEPWGEALGMVANQDARERLKEFHARAAMLVAGQLVLSPGLLIIILPVGALTAIFRSQFNSLRNIYLALRSAVPVSFLSLLEEEAARS